MNRTKTLVLLAVLTFLLLFVGQALGGRTGLVIALGLAGVMNFASYWWSDKIVLRMYGAQPVTEQDAPELYGIVRELAARGEIPVPKVYLIPEETPNAFATGRNPQNAVVAVTAGLMRLLNREELKGVIAHELGHVKNRDTLIMTVSATIAGALGMLADMAMWGALFGRSDDDEEGGSPIGGLIGIIVAPISTVFPGMGDGMLILSFVVVVLGGIGSVAGAAVGALLIGLTDTFGKVFFPSVSSILIYVLMAAVLLWRPNGILGRREV